MRLYRKKIYVSDGSDRYVVIFDKDGNMITLLKNNYEVWQFEAINFADTDAKPLINEYKRLKSIH